MTSRHTELLAAANNGILEGIHGYANYAPETPGRPAGSINLHIEPKVFAKFLLQRASLGHKPQILINPVCSTSNQAVDRNFSIFVPPRID